MRARYMMRVIQGNNVNRQVPVVVTATSAREAFQKALRLTDVHNPRVVVDKVEEVDG